MIFSLLSRSRSRSSLRFCQSNLSIRSHRISGGSRRTFFSLSSVALRSELTFSKQLLNSAVTIRSKQILPLCLDLDLNCKCKPFCSSSSLNIFWRTKMGDTQSSGLPDTTGIERKNKVKLTDAEWRAKLTPEEYSVCRNHGTERAWTGKLLNSKGKGIYQCACCGADLFNSSTKFDSGSGWPSFYDTLKDKDDDLPAVDTHTDRSHGMVRTEVLCGKCDSHLGHVFTDGPQPTGLRYCINSVSLKFKRDKKEESGGSSSKNEL